MRRRDFVKTVAAGAGVAAVGLPQVAAAALQPSADAAAPQADHPTLLSTGQVVPASAVGAGPTAEAPIWLFAPHRVGDVVSGEWRLEGVSAVTYGGFTVTLGDGFESARVTVCRVGAAGPRGVAQGQRLDYLLANAGHGVRATDEALAVAVHALAAIARPNEDARLEALPLLDFDARVRAWGPGVIL